MRGDGDVVFVVVSVVVILVTIEGEYLLHLERLGKGPHRGIYPVGTSSSGFLVTGDKIADAVLVIFRSHPLANGAQPSGRGLCLDTALL